jgi:DNA repair protein SbcC/Rad50
MIPKRIVLENFLSFGSPQTEIVFTDDEPLWVLSGPNGVGKSAVFDAMTYALYGEHRGGASDHASLVRHGANGFRVVFEFEFNGTSYQIARNRPLSGRPTQGIKQWAEGGWTKTIQLPAASGRQDPIRLWTERTLGIGFVAFKASVLLRQGEADAIITAGGTERLMTLKRIIGGERYEALSTRVHDKAREWGSHLKELRTQLDGLTPVTDADMKAAQEELGNAAAALSEARTVATAAAERVPRAEQWTALELERQELDERILSADGRLRNADAIRAKHARWNNLKAAVPMLRQALTLRGRLCEETEAIGKLRDKEKRLAEEADRLTTAADQEVQKAELHRQEAEEQAQKAKELRHEIATKEKILPTAEEVEKLKTELVGFPPDLAEQLDRADKKLTLAANALTAAGQATSRAAALLGQAEQQHRQFKTVGVGIPCSRCGQPVSEEHAEHERARLARGVQELKQKHHDAEAEEEKALAAKTAAEQERNQVETFDKDRAEKTQNLTEKRRILAKLGITVEADELRREIVAMRSDAGVHEQNVKNEAERRRLALAEANRLNADRLKTGKLLIDPLDSELRELDESGVGEEFSKLQQDVARWEEWVKQRAGVLEKIGEIPQDCRLAVAEAAIVAEEAEKKAAEADRVRNAAMQRSNELARQAEDYQKKVNDVAAAEKTAHLHCKLDDLLGKGGLQRELVRTAEREIVRLAQDTVQNLSDGDLTIELDDAAEGDDEAFSLRFRRADNPTPIGVHYLSGSQKFRVAISVALAIGRFAAGQARPLESVIIDEGFGSLDRDGLRAAAEELNRLRDHLRRIIVVSHQEDFAERFPVVIKLSDGENGTTAEAIRR